jgi:PPM family protein phosphatase
MVTILMHYKVVSCGSSDAGLVRQNNEDVWGELPELRLFAIADGMGGHRAGEIAARESINALFTYAKSISSINSRESAAEMMQGAVSYANQEVFRLSKTDEQYRGMGTTLCAVYFHDKAVVCVHVGDSRIYRIHRGKLEQVSVDHSLVRELIDLGQLNEKQAPDFLYRNILTKAIGTEPKVEPSINTLTPAKGDIYLLCTDGLTDMVADEEIEIILKKSPNIRDAVKQLISRAKERGGYDNITVVLMQIQEDHET